MARPISDIAFTPTVKAAQKARGSRVAYAKMEQRGGWLDVITPELEEFIAERESFYFGTASAEGQPYIQHRGGPKGFLKVLDEKTLAMADYAGNSQYISLGNLAENDKAFIRNFHFELPLHPKSYASYPVVSTANSSGLFEVVVRHILAVLRSRCAGFACPACRAADTYPARPLLST